MTNYAFDNYVYQGKMECYRVLFGFAFHLRKLNSVMNLVPVFCFSHHYYHQSFDRKSPEILHLFAVWYLILLFLDPFALKTSSTIRYKLPRQRIHTRSRSSQDRCAYLISIPHNIFLSQHLTLFVTKLG